MDIRITTGAIDGHAFGEVADYPEETARKLISLGYAEPVGGPAPADAPASKDELKARCRELGLSTGGNKDELKARIVEAERDQDAADEPEAEEADGYEDDEEPPALSPEVPR